MGSYPSLANSRGRSRAAWTTRRISIGLRSASYAIRKRDTGHQRIASSSIRLSLRTPIYGCSVRLSIACWIISKTYNARGTPSRSAMNPRISFRSASALSVRVYFFTQIYCAPADCGESESLLEDRRLHGQHPDRRYPVERGYEYALEQAPAVRVVPSLPHWV